MQQQWLAFLTMCSHQLWPKSGLIPNTHIYNAMLACPSEVSCHTSLLLIGRFLIGLWAVRHCDQQHKLRGQFTTPLLPTNISSQFQLSTSLPPFRQGKRVSAAARRGICEQFVVLHLWAGNLALVA